MPLRQLNRANASVKLSMESEMKAVQKQQSPAIAGLCVREFNGRYERIRTSDPFTPSEVRYQAALRTDVGRIIMIPHQKAMLQHLTGAIFANVNSL